MYKLMEEIKFNSFEEFVIKKAFAENHIKDSCFNEFWHMTNKELWELEDKGNYLAKVFNVMCWYYFS